MKQNELVANDRVLLTVNDRDEYKGRKRKSVSALIINSDIESPVAAVRLISYGTGNNVGTSANDEKTALDVIPRTSSDYYRMLQESGKFFRQANLPIVSLEADRSFLGQHGIPNFKAIRLQEPSMEANVREKSLQLSQGFALPADTWNLIHHAATVLPDMADASPARQPSFKRNMPEIGRGKPGQPWNPPYIFTH